MALREDGIDIGDEATSTDLKRHPEMLEQTDLIIAMTEQQARDLVERFPGADERPVFTLRSFAGEDRRHRRPVRKRRRGIRRCREEIKRLIPAIIDRIFHPLVARWVERDHMKMEFNNPSDAEIRKILSKPTTVAVVGCSDSPARDCFSIAKLLKAHGFKVIPVNPELDADALRSALGEKCYPDLASIPEPVEIVDVFRRSEFVPQVAEAAIAKGARILWCQLGVIHLDAARARSKPGMTVVMDRCPAIEYARLF